jgi:hypothetical protein
VSAATRPLPAPTEIGAPFWEAADVGRLVRPLCDSCGRSFFSPQVACPNCLSTSWTWTDSDGRGVLYSSTVVHRGPTPGFPVPYELAIVDLDEGWSMLTNLVGGEGPTPLGTRVEVEFLDLEDGHRLPVFRGVA